MQSTLYTAIYTIEMYYRNVQIWDMQCTIHVCHVYYYIQYRDVLKRCTNMGYAMKYTCVSCIWYLSIYMHDTRVSIYLHARYMCAMCMISWPNSFVHSFHTGYTEKETWTSLATAERASEHRSFSSSTRCMWFVCVCVCVCVCVWLVCVWLVCVSLCVGGWGGGVNVRVWKGGWMVPCQQKVTRSTHSSAAG